MLVTEHKTTGRVVCWWRSDGEPRRFHTEADAVKYLEDRKWPTNNYTIREERP